MKKMDRRDYLIRMGTGAAGIIGTAKLDVFTSPRKSAPSCLERRLAGPKNASMASSDDWPWIAKLPDETNVRLIFIGMMVFTYKKKEGRVVFHTENDHHQLKIFGYKRRGDACEELFPSITDLNRTDMDILIDKKSSDASFFRDGRFEREKDVGHANDFRWLLDLEGADFKYGKLDRTKKRFTSKLKVRHGTFYTYQHTNSTFRCEASQCNQPKLGHVAKVMAADIRFSPGETVLFKIPKKNVRVPLKYDKGVRYDIYFLNECEHCTESDFKMTFDAVEVNASETFDLKLVSRGKNEDPPGLCLQSLPYKIQLNDEAPCMGGGFGGGGGFP